MTDSGRELATDDRVVWTLDGTIGTVYRVNEDGTVWVAWDDGQVGMNCDPEGLEVAA